MSPQPTPSKVATIGIDTGKNTFHLVGLDRRGNIVLQLKTSRAQLERRLANLPSCLVGMEACSGTHHIARQLEALGHDVRLIPAQYVKPFLKGHKNDGSRRLHIALGGLPDNMRVKADPNVGVSAKTVGQLRKVAAWPENLAVAVPQEHFPESVVMVSKVSVSTRYAPKP